MWQVPRSLKITQKAVGTFVIRIRKTIQRGGGIVRMDGVVEVDESWIGGRARNMHKDPVFRTVPAKIVSDWLNTSGRWFRTPGPWRL
jgi:hypothetical protein